MFSLRFRAALIGAAMLLAAGCDNRDPASFLSQAEIDKGLVLITVQTAKAPQHFKAEPARTAVQQQRGLMFRTDLGPSSAMLFHPYPAEGGGPREASFWMKDTPTSLDIVFIRPDGTIESIAAGTEPFSEAPVASGEPVGAVLEIVAGRAAALGIKAGDKVRWEGFPTG